MISSITSPTRSTQVKLKIRFVLIQPKALQSLLLPASAKVSKIQSYTGTKLCTFVLSVEVAGCLFWPCLGKSPKQRCDSKSPMSRIGLFLLLLCCSQPSNGFHSIVPVVDDGNKKKTAEDSDGGRKKKKTCKVHSLPLELALLTDLNPDKFDLVLEIEKIYKSTTYGKEFLLAKSVSIPYKPQQ
jgi:hypothetical protein